MDWTVRAIRVISRRLGGRRWMPVADGAYACVHFAHAGLARAVTRVSRLRLDAQLYTFSDPHAPARRGPKPLKGKRMGQALPIRVSAWYRKSEATFSDVLAMDQPAPLDRKVFYELNESAPTA